MKHTLLMLSLSLSLLLANTRAGYCFQVNNSTLPPSSQSLNPHAEKIKKNIEKLGIGHQVTAVLTIDKEYHGTISDIAAESFQVNEVDLKQVVTIKYDETEKVYKNYYHNDVFLGRDPHKHEIVLIAILSFVIVGLAYGIKHRAQ